MATSAGQAEGETYALLFGSGFIVQVMSSQHVKNSRKWGDFFDFRAAYAEAPKLGGRISPIRITLPDGEVVGNDQADREKILSRAFGREIALRGGAS